MEGQPPRRAGWRPGCGMRTVLFESQSSGVSCWRDRGELAPGKAAHGREEHVQRSHALGLKGNAQLGAGSASDAFGDIDQRVIAVPDHVEDSAPFGIGRGSESLGVDIEALFEFDKFLRSEPFERGCGFTAWSIRPDEHDASVAREVPS